MVGKRLDLLLGVVVALICVGSALAVDCTVCTECSADPAFVQRDMRNPQVLPILKRFGSPELQQEGVSTVVVLSDSDASGQPTHTVVLLGDQGGSESVAVKGDLPAELKALAPVE